MAARVLVTAIYLQPEIERFRHLFQRDGIDVVVPPVEERMEEEELLPWVADIDGAICGDDRYTARVIAAAPRLRVISKWGTGIDSIDLEACHHRGISVRNTPNAFSEPVADSVFAYVLGFARGAYALDRLMKAGTWNKIRHRALRECTLGVVGVGNVGKAVVRRACAFGMRILGNDPAAIPPDFLAATGIAMVPLPKLLSESDFVTVHCDLNPTSRHLMNASTFALMKPSAFFVNTARGPIVDEPALVAALGAGAIAGAALDVFEEEPLPASSRLRQMDNVFLAPHNANSSPAAWERVHVNTIENCLAVLRESRAHQP